MRYLQYMYTKYTKHTERQIIVNTQRLSPLIRRSTIREKFKYIRIALSHAVSANHRC